MKRSGREGGCGREGQVLECSAKVELFVASKASKARREMLGVAVVDVLFVSTDGLELLAIESGHRSI